MPLVVACPKCNAKFKLPDQLIGKPIQCKACQARFQVGKPRKALPDQSAGKAGTAVATSTITPEQRAEMARLGVDGPLQSRPDRRNRPKASTIGSRRRRMSSAAAGILPDS